MPRSFDVALTEDELYGIRIILRTLPTCFDDPVKGKCFLTSDIDLGCRRIGMVRTPDQVQKYLDYWNTEYGGIVIEDIVIDGLRVCHKQATVAEYKAQIYDSNGDGFIQEDEFAEILDKIVIHFPFPRQFTFAEFIIDADINQDGKVSIEECDKWIERYMGLDW